MIAVLFLFSCLTLVTAYFWYGRLLEKWLSVNPARPTPAWTQRDGVDYVPTSAPVLFGHHFSSIAGAGPIVGPIIAGLAFGWLPALIWILVGAIFVGGVHDFSALMASLRHQGRSIGEICREYFSPSVYRIFLIFTWFALVYVQIVFIDLTSSGFAPAAAEMARQGGSVATASIFYIFLAVIFGLLLYRLRLPLLAATVIFVPMVFAGLWLGTQLPLVPEMIPAFRGSVKNTWNLILLGYCFIASILPVWLLLQPRDYLSSFLLFACLVAGGAGLIFSGAAGTVGLNYPAFLGWHDAHLGFLFPALIITVACGAVSGFHSLVASGTTSKQLDSERSARPVSYGAMMVEGVLALLALATVMMISSPSTGRSPVAVFGAGIGVLLAGFGLPAELATVFGLLAVSTFLLTTLDTCTRLGRFVFQEFFGIEGVWARMAATAATLALPAVVIFITIKGPEGIPIPAWQAIWPAFGATNQLLASLALLVVYVWLRRGRRRVNFILLPMVFIFTATMIALAQLAWTNLIHRGNLFLGGASLVLSLLALYILLGALIGRRGGAKEPATDRPVE